MRIPPQTGLSGQPMDQHQAVDDSEFLYRRIHPHFYDPALSMSVLPQAFRPSRSDTTGLSVLRAGFCQPADVLPRDPAKAIGYRVTRLAVRDLRSLGLTVVPEPIAAGPPGHAVIPELSWQRYETAKRRWKPVLVELARLASADIVRPN